MKISASHSLRFSYFASLLLIAVTTYSILFLNNIPVLVFSTVIGLSFLTWISVGHFSDFIFDFASLRIFRLISKHRNTLQYVGCFISNSTEHYEFYTIINDSLYNVYYTYRAEKEFVGEIEITYDISISQEFDDAAYLNNKHPYYRLIDRYNSLIKKQCLSVLEKIDNPYDLLDTVKRTEDRGKVLEGLIRKNTITQILKSL